MRKNADYGGGSLPPGYNAMVSTSSTTAFPPTPSTGELPRNAPFVILCVTGPMASGKNAASAILEKNGFAAVDADKLVHQILSEPAFQKKVIETFAPYAAEKHISLTSEDGSLNRRSLGALIFKDKKLLAKQESLIHPAVNQRIEEFIASHPSQDIVLNATVLYKIPAIRRCNAILFVTAPLFTRFSRAKKRDNMKTAQILARFWQQRSLFAKYKISNADIHKVKNTGNLNALESKINAFLKVCR